jgi:uncharacterized OsmC-like protein
VLNVKEHKLIKVALEGYAPTASLTEVRVRGHSFVIDEPPYRHGTDVGPTPLETLLGALIGKIDVLGHLDHRGIDRVADVPVPFPIIELKVNATTSGTEDDMLRLREDLNARCPMSVILKQAGSQIVESWVINYVQK